MYSQTEDENNSASNVANGHEWVDLGLSVKWATCNVGANTPEAEGNYYAWGEIAPKDEYTNNNSVTYGQQMDDFSGNAQYDAATANWGGDWRMPTSSEMSELVNKCTWEWTTQNNVKGYMVTGPNGNSIFLPVTGYFYSSTFTSGTCGYSYYWCSSPDSGNAGYAYRLVFDGASRNVYNYYYRSYGCTVRPVRE